MTQAIVCMNCPMKKSQSKNPSSPESGAGTGDTNARFLALSFLAVSFLGEENRLPKFSDGILEESP